MHQEQCPSYVQTRRACNSKALNKEFISVGAHAQCLERTEQNRTASESERSQELGHGLQPLAGALRVRRLGHEGRGELHQVAERHLLEVRHAGDLVDELDDFV